MGGRLGRFFLLCLLSALSAFSAVSRCDAHPVPQRKHDRELVVHLRPAEVVVNYRLEVDDFTVVFVDLPGVVDDAGVTFGDKSEPDEALKKKAPADLGPKDDLRLRTATATFRVGKDAPAAPAGEPQAAQPQGEDWSSLKGLLALEPQTLLQW